MSTLHECYISGDRVRKVRSSRHVGALSRYGRLTGLGSSEGPGPGHRTQRPELRLDLRCVSIAPYIDACRPGSGRVSS